MDKKIIVIVGHTGAGKTTVSSELSALYSLPIVSFANCGKEFAKSNNFERIRDCWTSMGKKQFSEGITRTMMQRVEQVLAESDALIIDGIYDEITIGKIRSRYDDVKSVYLVVPDEIRFNRIAKRCADTMVRVNNENERKEQIKVALGIEKVLSKADYFINATGNVESIVQKICDKLFLGKVQLG